MNKNTLSLTALALSLVFSFVVVSHVSAGMGPLQVSSANPRYFMDTNGKSVYLTGSHTWNNLLEYTDGSYGIFPYTAYLNFLSGLNHNFIRLWSSQTTYSTPLPWLRTGSGTALDGLPKFDLYNFNQAYFDRLRTRIIEAGNKGIYVDLILFDGHSLHSDGSVAWIMHPFNINNNINNVNGDANGDNVGIEFSTLLVPTATGAQKAYIRKVVDTINDLDNVLYEISNEAQATSDNTAWQYDMINYVKQYESSKPKQHPVGMTAQWSAATGNGSNTTLFNSPGSWVSPTRGGTNGEFYITDPLAATGQKVVIADTDHLAANTTPSKAWVWKTFTRGINPILMDFYPEFYGGTLSTGMAEARKSMGHTNTYAKKMDLASMIPHGDLTSTTYALANPGSEYIIYNPLSGSFTLNMMAGNYNYEWFNPITGIVSQTGTITATAGNRSFTPDFTGESVLYLKSTTVTPTPTPGASTCSNLLNSTLTVPASFAASFNWFTTAKELLMQASCGSGGSFVTVGNGSNTQYIYKTGYVWQNSQWTSFNYSGSNMDSGGNWFIGSANHSLGTLDLTQKQSVLSYICDWNGTVWHCGCHDSSCTTGYWNLQQFKQ